MRLGMRPKELLKIVIKGGDKENDEMELIDVTHSTGISSLSLSFLLLPSSIDNTSMTTYFEAPLPHYPERNILYNGVLQIYH